MFKPDVVCIGSATVDHILTINQPFSQIHSGDKILVNSKSSYSGGGATNAAAAISTFGLKAAVISKLGEDHDAQFILHDLAKYNIKINPKKRSSKNTDNSTIIVSEKDHDRIIYTHKGASQDLHFHDIKKRHLRTKWMYLATLVGASFKTAKEIAQYTKKKKRPLLFNPSLYLAKKGKTILKPILEAASILVLNKEEAQALLKTKNTKPKTLLQELISLGPKTVIITDGPRMMWALSNNTIYTLNPPKIKIIDTAGAGDAFTGALLAALIKKYPLEKAMALGQANASSIIQYHGPKNILLTEKEALQQIKKQKIIVQKTII